MCYDKKDIILQQNTFPIWHNDDLSRYSRFVQKCKNIYHVFTYIHFILYIQWENFIQRKRSTVRRRFTQGNCKEKFWVIYTNRRVVHESHSDLLSICNPQQNTSHNYKRCNKKVKGINVWNNCKKQKI